MFKDTPMSLMVRKLESRGPLDDADRAAIVALPHLRRTYEPSSYLVREGEPARKFCSFIESGLAYRQKLTANGARQIVSIQMTGDFIDFQHLFLRRADHNVQALTRIETIDIEREALQALSSERPAVGRAMWIDALIDASVFREWVVNVGRRDARTRIAHLLCEVAVRMRAAGLASDGGFELPMTQEQVGDATGLTSVHVNRTLKSLAEDGIITRHGRYIGFADWNRIRQAADFSDLYLHLDQTAPIV
ncbi:Crp/Fnr family transcriptional regulator [Sphingomonas sp.]|uniref:Crp/Fnr family transcriptional regulator n=1 Tax=Sphingomonas sp. TaxID=28214 RepID=UPI0035BBBD9A